MTTATATAPDHRDPKSVRMWGASYADLQRAAENAGVAPATLAGDTVEAVLCGYVRCSRCTTPVPVGFGDCTGLDMAEAITGAVRAVYAQPCWTRHGTERRPGHSPVTVGAQDGSPVSSRSGTGRKAAGRKQGSTARTEPPEAPAVFLAPVPHATPVKRGRKS